VSPHKPSLVTNRLLDGLPHREYERFLASSEAVELQSGDILAAPGEPIRHAYFPSDSYISLNTPMNQCNGLGIGLVGNEGMLGVSLLLAVDVSPWHALVRGGGAALRIGSGRFKQEIDRSPALRQLLHRYLYVLLGQFAQSAACMRFHLVAERLARWLLMTQDRTHTDRFHVTHEFLAAMLGVRRVGITKAATLFQEQRLISYRRGEVTIVDRQGLEAVSCNCYAADNGLYTRIMGADSSSPPPPFGLLRPPR